MGEMSIIGREVFCKRNGTTSIVVAEDRDTLIIESDGVKKAITRKTYERWYTLVPQEQDEEEMTEKEEKIISVDKKGLPAGEPGIGLALRNKFIEIVKDRANQELDISVDNKNRRDTIRYNGRNVFECNFTNRRFNVACHPNSLTPDNLQRVNKLAPKEWGWALSAKFIFTDMSQVPLMRTIIVDGLFYRQKTDYGEE